MYILFLTVYKRPIYIHTIHTTPIHQESRQQLVKYSAFPKERPLIGPGMIGHHSIGVA